jgi:hypothetical protein
MGGGNADRAIYHKGLAGIDAGAGVLTPPTKLLLEYGIVPAVLFYIFLIYCLFHRAPEISFSFAQLVLHVFVGGGLLLVSPYIILFFILGVMFRTPEQQADHAPALPS